MLQQSTSTELFPSGTARREAVAESVPRDGHATLLKGLEAILRVAPRLAILAAGSGQSGETDSLEFFLKTPDAMKKIPHLALFACEGRTPCDVAHGLSAAALVFEYRTLLGGAKVFSTSDSTGRRNILAPPFARAATAARAARTFIERGAHIVHIAFCETHHSEQERRAADGGLVQHPEVPPIGFSEQAIASELRRFGASGMHGTWALAERDMPTHLELFPTFDATLARIGQRTRSNLRYYRRRAESELGARFVPQPHLTLAEFLEFSRRCTFPIPRAPAIQRFHTISSISNCSMLGVLDAHGGWLSLVGIRHHGRYTEIDWQMNRDDRPTNSLGIVMRSYLIEHEIARGSTRLYIEGGTPHPIGRSFLKQRVGELTVTRRSAYVAGLRRLAPTVFPAKNYIGQAITHPGLVWKPW